MEDDDQTPKNVVPTEEGVPMQDVEPKTNEINDAIRGVSSREEIVWQLFRHLARGDFKHDFGERVAGRDLFTANDANRFFEIAKNVSTKGKVFLSQNFINKAVGNTIYELLGDTFDAIIPNFPGVVKDTEFKSEDGLFNIVTGKTFEETKKVPSGTVLSFNLPNGIPRSYTLRSSDYRLSKDRNSQDYKTNRNIAAMFEEVTGKKKFALIIDASGGLPLTEVLNTTLTPEAKDTEFFIIENIENASDSATKLTNIKEKLGGPSVKPTLRFLRDSANTVVYPIWENSSDPKSNIYSALKIVINRVKDDETEADIEVIVGDTKKIIHIGDVSNSSNVKNASLRAFAELLDKGSSAPEPYVYTLIKRMGDWCQALSLLDLDRQYDVLNQSHQSEGTKPITLRDMLVDTEIGIVTNDRILLTYCLLHGINVFYTTAMDMAKLIYFKNNNDVPDENSLAAITQKLFDEDFSKSPYDTAMNETHKTQLQQRLSDYESKLKSETNIGQYILGIRSYFSNVGKLRDEFAKLDGQYVDKYTIYNTPTSPNIDRFNAINSLISLAIKQRVDIQHNTTTLDDLEKGNFSGRDADLIRINSLMKKLATGGRITKSVEIVEAKNILLSVRDDINQLLLNKIITPDRISDLLKTSFEAPNKDERSQTNYNEIMSVMPTLRILVPGPQQGGGNVDVVYDLIRKRSIRVLPKFAEEFTSTVNVYKQGSQYIDEKLNAYTVSDEYIVTEDDLKVIESFIHNQEGANQEKALYIRNKYLLLLCDIQLNKLFTLDWEPLTTGEDSGYFEEGTIQKEQLLSIWNRAAELEQAIGGKFSATNNTQEKLNAIRTRLIQRFPLNINLQEVQDSLALQTVAGQSKAIASHLTLTIAQRFALDLGLIVRNTLNTNELNRLGLIIESTLISPSILPEQSVPLKLEDYASELVKQAILEWNPNTDPNTINKILLTVKQFITQKKRPLDVDEDRDTKRQFITEKKRPLDVDEDRDTKRQLIGGRRPLYQQQKAGRRPLYG